MILSFYKDSIVCKIVIINEFKVFFTNYEDILSLPTIVLENSYMIDNQIQDALLDEFGIYIKNITLKHIIEVKGKFILFFESKDWYSLSSKSGAENIFAENSFVEVGNMENKMSGEWLGINKLKQNKSEEVIDKYSLEYFAGL